MLVSRLRGAALVAAATVALAACGSTQTETAADRPSEATVSIQDNHGTQIVTTPPASVVATDNRTFQTLDDWGVKLSAGAVTLMPPELSYTKDASVVNLGNHIEPKLESVVAAEPSLIINGQRFAQFHADFKRLVPEATMLELDPREGQPLDAELKRQTTALGEVFGKQAEATALNDELDASIARVKAAYKPETKVMGVITSGGEIGYVAPTVGRTLGPVFDIFNFTPALSVKDSSNDHQGDDISVEAIAKSNPDLILVLDRDAAVAPEDGKYQPAAEVLQKSEALRRVSAIASGKVVYMPGDTYLNEGIQTYTEYFNALADELEKA